MTIRKIHGLAPKARPRKKIQVIHDSAIQRAFQNAFIEDRRRGGNEADKEVIGFLISKGVKWDRIMDVRDRAIEKLDEVGFWARGEVGGVGGFDGPFGF